MSTGADIIRISRIEKLIESKIPRKIYTEYESDYISSSPRRAQTAAGIYAAKEAVLKALGKGISLPLRDVCIMHRIDGSPYICLTGAALNYAKNLGITDAEISISHDGEYAVAYAHLTEDNKLSKYNKVMDKLKNAPSNAISEECAKNLLKPRKENTHKGDYGRLYAVAGSVGLTGAAYLACTSALRCGSGLITLACPSELNPIMECKLTEVMTKPLESTDGHISQNAIGVILSDLQKTDVCLLGPGLSRNEDITALTEVVTANSPVPMVIDADGLYALSKNIDVLYNAKQSIILTPHIGEFSYLTGEDTAEILKDTEKYGLQFAKKYGVTLVLKSHRTIVCTPDGECFVNMLGNSGMATGGTGDVLAGCIASFVGQGLGAKDASKLGVYIHSLASDMASEEKGEYSLTPSDIIDYIPYSIQRSVGK